MAEQEAREMFMMMNKRSTEARREATARFRANVRGIVARGRKRRARFWEKQEKERRSFIMQLLAYVAVQAPPERVEWIRERSSHWWTQIVQPTFRDTDWLANFRMRRTTFEHLVDQLRNHIGRADTNRRRCISVEIRVAVTVWVLATGAGYRSVGHMFGIATSTCCEIFKETCAVIVRVLQPKYIKFPTGARLTEVIEGFATRFGFPNCGGAIDGTHIPIIAPHHHHTDYHNRKGYYSIVAQVCCDHEYQATSIAVGWPGRVHDARVLANSTIYTRGEAGVLFPDRPVALGDATVPIVLLGDPAYPLRPWLMKPFSDTGRLTREQTTYNYRLSRARMTIENTFGRCKARWRILKKRTDIRTEDVVTVVVACFTLNNMCEVHKEEFDTAWDTADNQEPVNVARDMDMDGNGGDVREGFMAYFSS